MKYGLALPTGGECGDPAFVVELAVLAEATGWDGVFLEDYICFQGDDGTHVRSVGGTRRDRRTDAARPPGNDGHSTEPASPLEGCP